MAQVLIHSPVPGQRVAHKVRLDGIAQGLDDGTILRTVVVPGTWPTYQPQAGRLHVDPTTCTIRGVTYVGNSEYGTHTGERFRILIVRCSEAAEDELDAYLEGAADLGWPGLRSLPAGTRVLAELAIVRDDYQAVDPPARTSSGTSIETTGGTRDTESPEKAAPFASEGPGFCYLLDKNGRSPLSNTEYGEVVAHAATYDLFIDMTRTVEAGRYFAGRRTLHGKFEEVHLKPRLAAIWLELIERGCALRPGQLGSVTGEHRVKLMEQARRSLDINLSRYEWRALHTVSDGYSTAKRYNFNPPDGFRMAILLPVSPPESKENDINA